MNEVSVEIIINNPEIITNKKHIKNQHGGTRLGRIVMHFNIEPIYSLAPGQSKRSTSYLLSPQYKMLYTYFEITFSKHIPTHQS